MCCMARSNGNAQRNVRRVDLICAVTRDVLRGYLFQRKRFERCSLFFYLFFMCTWGRNIFSR